MAIWDHLLPSNDKGSTAYEESINVPLYVSFPNQRGYNYSNYSNYPANSVEIDNVCSSVDILPFLYALTLGNDVSWRQDPGSIVSYLLRRESIFDFIYGYPTYTTQRRNVTINNVTMPYVLHTSDDIPAPLNNNNPSPRHVLGMRVGNSSTGISKFVQYSPWPGILNGAAFPGYNNSSGQASSYTQPTGNNASNSQFELYLNTNPSELANDFGAHPTTANNYAQAMYGVLNTELYGIPTKIAGSYYQAFENYWTYEAGTNHDNNAMEDDDNIQLLL